MSELSLIRGYHVYKNIWNARMGEILSCSQQQGNLHDIYAVAVMKGNDVVGHIPRKISSLCYFFLSKGGRLECKVTGKRQHSIDLPQGGLEIPCLLTFKSDSPSDIVKISKLINNIPIDDDKTNDIIEPDIKKQK